MTGYSQQLNKMKWNRNFKLFHCTHSKFNVEIVSAM